MAEPSPQAADGLHDEPTQRARLLGLAALVTAIACFGISFGVIQWPGTSGAVIAWWRLIGASVLWWGLVFALHRFRGRPLPSRRVWRLSIPAALASGLYISFFFTAVTRTSVAHATFIGNLNPLLVIPAGAVFFGERPNWKALRFGALSLVGLVIVLSFGPAGGTATVEGDLLMVLVLGFVVSFTMTSKYARSRGVELVDFMAIMMTGGLVTATPVALVLASDEMWPLSTKTWIAVAILWFLTGSAAHGLMYYSHKTVPVATISVTQVGQPAVSVLAAWLIVGETISRWQLPGMALMIVGMALVVWFSQRAPTGATGTSP